MENQTALTSIIEFLKEQIKKERENIDFWKASTLINNNIYSMNAVQRLAVLNDVLEFIEETFKLE